MPVGMGYRRWLGAFAVAILIIAPSPLLAAQRMALVIGMTKYQNVVPLENATSDAKGVASTLQDLGFDVTEAIDQPLDGLISTINTFSHQAETADIAVIYYAGHGVEAAGENFLIPVDVKLKTLADIGQQALPADSLLDAVQSARRLRVVILDSCRNNPFAAPQTAGIKQQVSNLVLTAADKIIPGGLAAPSPEKGTLVVYAAKDGEVAFDGKGGHSPFARALMDQLPDKNTEIGMMFRKVRDEVMAETHNQQEPHFYGSLPGIPYFLAAPGLGSEAVADRRKAWGSLDPDQIVQMTALASTGNVRALIGLGYMSLNPGGNDFDPSKAFRYFSEASDKGDSEAMFELAKLYEKGIGAHQDYAKALSLYKKSAALGFADAQNDLGFLYYQGALGVKRNPEKAINLFLKAADHKHPQAMYNVASLIDDGVIKGKTPADAAHYLYLALRSGVQDVLRQLTERPDQFKLSTREALQQILMKNGFYKGGIDGSFGPGTQRGLKIAFGEDVTQPD